MFCCLKLIPSLPAKHRRTLCVLCWASCGTKIEPRSVSKATCVFLEKPSPLWAAPLHHHHSFPPVVGEELSFPISGSEGGWKLPQGIQLHFIVAGIPLMESSCQHRQQIPFEMSQLVLPGLQFQLSSCSCAMSPTLRASQVAPGDTFRKVFHHPSGPQARWAVFLNIVIF